MSVTFFADSLRLTAGCAIRHSMEPNDLPDSSACEETEIDVIELSDEDLEIIDGGFMGTNLAT